MLVEDLPVGVLDDIATTYDLAGWYELAATPVRRGRAGAALVRRCAEQLQVEVPEGLDGDGPSPKRLLEFFELVPDDLPEVFKDGVPTTGDEPSTD